MQKPTITLVFSPNLLFLAALRIKKMEPIYYAEPNNWLDRFLFRRTRNLLSRFQIMPFSYATGIGFRGDGYIHEVGEKICRLTDRYYEFCGEKGIVENFGKAFSTDGVQLFWKHHLSQKIRLIAVNYLGLLENFSFCSTIYVPRNSCESLVVEEFAGEQGDKAPSIVFYRKLSFNLLFLLFYFLTTLYRLFRSTFAGKEEGKKDFKVMLETARNFDDSRSFNIMEWWNEEKIKKDEILAISIEEKEPGRRASYQSAKDFGLSRARINVYRKIPIGRWGDLLSTYVLLPLRNFYPLLISRNFDFYLLFLLKSYFWYLFFLNYAVRAYIFPNAYRENLQDIICDRFGCETVKYHLSYIGALSFPEHRYFRVGHYILWGEAQIFHSREYFAARKVHFTGCHGLSYLSTIKKEMEERKKARNEGGRKNVVFFDNRMNKNLSNPEEFYLRFLDLVVKTADLGGVNIFFRPKGLRLPQIEEFNDKEAAQALLEEMKKKKITVLATNEYDVIHALVLADLVVSSMVGTPFMLANMAHIPAIAYSPKINNSPDPVMRNYKDILLFEKEENALEAIGKVIQGENLPRLFEDDLKQLNHFLDFKGLERLQDIISEIIHK